MDLTPTLSTYYTFCGNGRFVVSPGRTPPLKAAVCSKWLHPILTSEYPRFSSWMLYGERGGGAHTQVGVPHHYSLGAKPQTDTLRLSLFVLSITHTHTHTHPHLQSQTWDLGGNRG